MNPSEKKIRCGYCRKKFRSPRGRDQHVKKRRAKYGDERLKIALQNFPKIIHQ